MNDQSDKHRPLPKELLSLVHHVELDKAEWWTKGVRHLAVVALWTAGTPLSLEQIKSSLEDLFGLQINADDVRTHIEFLLSTTQIKKDGPARYLLSEECRQKLQQDLDAATTIETAVQQRFVENFGLVAGLDPVKIWTAFQSELLDPYIRELGAETYKLINGSAFAIDPRWMERFLSSYHSDVRKRLYDAISVFLDPRVEQVREYVMRLMSAHFFVSAATLSPAVAAKLQKRRSGAVPTFSLFLDTNFVLSAFGLHTDALTDAATSLTTLAKTLSGRVNIQLYVLPATVDEAKRVLIAMRSQASRVRLGPNIVDVATSGHVSGVIQRYIKASKASNYNLNAQEYFGAFIDNIILILRSKDIEHYNRDLATLRVSQPVVDDINDQLKYEQTKYGSKGKSYEKLEHDMTLWHFIKGQRANTDESPLDSRYWAVTLDNRLLRFDVFKKRGAPSTAPVCVHPSTILQMLQFWVPRSNEFDEAMFSAIRLPLLSQEFDVEAEKVTIRILGAISQWDNSTQLSTEVIENIVINQALRKKLEKPLEEAAENALVREALVDENTRIRELAEEAAREAAAQREAAKASARVAESLLADAEQSKAESAKIADAAQKRIGELEEGLKDGHRVSQELTAQAERLAAEVSAAKADHAKLVAQRSHDMESRQVSIARRRAVTLAIVCCVVLLAVDLVVFLLLPSHGRTVGWAIVSLVFILGISIQVFVSKAEAHDILKDEIVVRRARWLCGVLFGGVLLGTIVNVLSDNL